MSQKATNQGTKVWPDLSPPAGFMQGPYPSGRSYANPPAPGKVRGQLGRADVGAVEYALKEGSGRITKINEGTRAGIRKRIQEAIEQGMSPAEAGKYVREWSGFDEYRAERIARTEMMFSYNAAATRTYRDLGVTHVVADDGDEDEECAARHGQVFTVEEAEGIIDHPNGTLDWLPIEPTMGEEVLRGELDQVRPIAGGVAPPVPAAPDPLKVAADALLDKVAQGGFLTADESQLFSQVVQAGHITSTDAIAAINQGQAIQAQKQLGQKLLGKLNVGDDLTAGEWDELAKIVEAGHVTEAQANAAMSQQYVAKQAKQTAQQYLDQMHQGADLGWAQMKQLDEYVQQGFITQDQVNAAHLAKQAMKQKLAIDDAIQAMDGGYASDAQKQLVMDALGQGALDASQSAKLTQVIAKQMQGGHAATNATGELKQALWDVTTPTATPMQKQAVLDAVKQGTLSVDDELGVTKGLVKQLQTGKALDPEQKAIMDALRMKPKSVVNEQTYIAAQKQGVLKQLESAQGLQPEWQSTYSDLKIAGHLTDQEVGAAIAKSPKAYAPTQAAPPPVTPPAQAAPKATKLKATKAKGDTFNEATFAPKDYPTREAHSRALSAWQRKTNSNLSWEAKEAMRSYTNSGYTEMNGMLRGVNLQYHSPDSLRRVKEQVDLVRQSMHPTTQDVVVRRGTTTHMFGPGGTTQIPADDVMRLVQPGTEWVDGGFMSTSINRAHSWSGDVLLELKVPKGTPAAWAQAISNYKHEYEILLDAGTRIVVESVERSPYGGQIKIVAHVKPR